MQILNNKYKLTDIYCRHTYLINDLVCIDKKIFKNEIIEIQQHESNKEIYYLIVKLEDSIHSKFIRDEKKYSPFYESYVKTSKQIEHSKENFKELIEKYSLNELQVNKIKLKKFKINNQKKYLIVDGLHRLSIYYHKVNSESIKRKYINLIK